MIITKQKPISEILEYVKPYNKVLLVGCDGCFQPPRSEREAEVLGLLLQLKNKLEKSSDSAGFSAKAMTVFRQCDDRIAATSLRPVLKDYKPDAIISMACGIGVQMLARLFDIPVFPAQNTVFIGAEIHEDNTYQEQCSACGNCYLGYTGGICPITNCAKSLLNGPCGGTIGGMCEVGGYENPCAWVEIWKKLKAQGRLDLFKAFKLPRNYRLATSPRKVKVKDTFSDSADESGEDKEAGVEVTAVE
ncbi:MAG: methylenetetrahydrofolate reductase C-terminal domain-containing protein [Promethearchaeota archaeon]